MLQLYDVSLLHHWQSSLTSTAYQYYNYLYDCPRLCRRECRPSGLMFFLQPLYIELYFVSCFIRHGPTPLLIGSFLKSSKGQRAPFGFTFAPNLFSDSLLIILLFYVIIVALETFFFICIFTTYLDFFSQRNNIHTRLSQE